MGDPTIPELAAWCRRKSADLLTGGSTTDGMNLRAIAVALERAERLEAASLRAQPGNAAFDAVAAALIAIGSSRAPDVTIGDSERPYLRRWFLTPRSDERCVYLHQFLRPDDDRALHDHPADSVSLVLSGAYTEVTYAEGDAVRKPGTAWTEVRTRWLAGDVIARPARQLHRIELDPRTSVFPDGGWAPCWTLFMFGSRAATGGAWGFLCGTPEAPRFVPWQGFVDPTDPGRVGPGCG